MQLLPTSHALQSIRPADPALARQVLVDASAQLSRLDRQLRSDAAAGALISQQWPVDIAMVAGDLRRGAGMISRFGSREALVGARMVDVAADLVAMSGELRAASAAGTHFVPNDPFIARLLAPTDVLRTAIDVLDSSSSWG